MYIFDVIISTKSGLYLQDFYQYSKSLS